MSPPDPNGSTVNLDLRQAVRRPRESDGVGNALRNVFGGAASLPQDLSSLVARLNRCD
jgi:hypothetical protein